MAASRIVSLSKKIIKPFSPTPSFLRRQSLSFIDHLASPAYIPLAFFYPKPKNNFNHSSIHQLLQNSLSKTLATYYPFAGRINDDVSIDCNDTGAEFSNVRLNCSMSEILNDPNNHLNLVFPQGIPWTSASKKSLLVAQLSHLDCGGVVVSLCFSHKIADGYSISKFMNDWATTTRDSGTINNPPPLQFDTSSFFPVPMDRDPWAVLPDIENEPQPCVVSRRYHFSSASLKRLKDTVAMDATAGVQDPTRVEIATAVIHKCVASVAMEKTGTFKPCLLSHILSMRPPVPLNTIGNAGSFIVTLAATEDDIQVPKYVSQLRKCKVQFRDKFKDLTRNQVAAPALETIEKGVKLLARNGFDFYRCSSGCHLGFYGTDFGWGRPVRVIITNPPLPNLIGFFDAPTGEGIDVTISLTEQDMSIFQTNKELLHSASPIV